MEDTLYHIIFGFIHLAKKQNALNALRRLIADGRTDLRSKLRGNHHQRAGAEIPPPVEFSVVEEDASTPVKIDRPSRRHSPIIFDTCNDSKNDTAEVKDYCHTSPTPPASKRSKYCDSSFEKRSNGSNRHHQQNDDNFSPKAPLLTTPSTSSNYEPAMNYSQYFENSASEEHHPQHLQFEHTMAADGGYNVLDNYHHQPVNSYNENGYFAGGHEMVAAYPEQNTLRNFSTDTQHYRRIIILDWCNPEKLRRSTEILSVTAQHHHTALSFSYRKADGFL